MTPPVHVGTPPVGTPDWPAARLGRINGSEIAAVLGISPYESPFSLWHRKNGNLGEVAQNDVMRWGNLLEPVILEEFGRRHDEFYVTHGGGLWRHHQRGWQGGSPDGRLYLQDNHHREQPDELFEAKTARFDDNWGEEDTDQIPVNYRAQCLWYLDVFGLKVCRVAVLISGSDYREYRVEHNEAEVAPMRAAARAFLDTLGGDPPPLDGSEATYDAVKELSPEVDGHDVDLTAAVAVPYLRALAEYADASIEKRRCAAEVINAMGTAQYARYSGERIASRVAKGDAAPHLRAANGASDLLREATAA